MSRTTLIVASLLLGGFILAMLWWRARRGLRRPVGFFDYVRNPHLRPQMGSVIEERDRLVAQLAELPADDLVEVLLDDDRHDLASRAIEAAGPRVVPELIAAISDPRYRRKTPLATLERMHALTRRTEPLTTVLDCLAEFGPAEAIPAVADLVHDDNEELRRRAALLIGSTGADEAVELLKTCCSDEDSDVRSYACMGTMRAIDAGRTTASFRAGAFDAIQPLVYRKSFPARNREAARCLLGLDRQRAVEYLTRPEHLAADRPGLQHALDALREAGVTIDPAPLVRLAVELENSPDKYARKRVMRSVLLLLAHADSKDAAQVIEQATRSSDSRIREAAVEALALRAGLEDPFGDAFDRLSENGWESLSEPQRIVVAVRILTGEVENGGFSQYFVNSSGDRWRDALNGLSTIGAHADRALLEQALAKFGPDGPSVARAERHRQLARIVKKDDEAFKSIEDDFYKDPDEREVLLLRYIIAHAEDFRPAE